MTLPSDAQYEFKLLYRTKYLKSFLPPFPIMETMMSDLNRYDDWLTSDTAAAIVIREPLCRLGLNGAFSCDVRCG